MSKLKLSNEEIREYLGSSSPQFPKYTTQIINLANQNAQGTRPKVVGQLSELIQKFPGKTLAEWEKWYLKNHPEAISIATAKIAEMLSRLKEAMNKIDQKLVEQWVKDLVIVKTFVGLRFQEAILKKVADQKSEKYKLATPEEESKGIDGFIGKTPVSIKPATYKSKQALGESIETEIIYYTKKKDGIEIEFD
ncbi:MAG: MjaI family restriction endonuclease [candidate division Zixibacteria bacterium]|nr:MjaI family restriction endonuclease [candidate division Zixibacteria bacterium]